MEEICRYHKYGYCKFKESCTSYHAERECENGYNCPNIKACRLRHPKMCKKMVLEGHCRLGVRCAYRHKPRLISHHEDTKTLHEDMKTMKAEIDVLKNTVKSLLTIKEEGEIIKKDIRNIKEEIKFLVAFNKETAEKINQLEYDCQYDTEEESETVKEDEINV